MTSWQILTGEYPPQPGGVSDYTRLVATELAEAGDAVTVWAPPAAGEAIIDRGVTVRRLPDHFGLRSLRVLDQHLNRAPAPRRLLVQYVPHAFGWKALNIPFCLWLRSRRHDSVWVMFHEVAFPIERGQNLVHNALGIATHSMASIVGGAAERAFVSIPAWVPLVESCAPAATVTWLPVPSSIPVVDDPPASASLHVRYGNGHPLVGHFGTYGDHVRPLIMDALAPLLSAAECRVLLIGRGSAGAARDFADRMPEYAARVHGTDDLSADEVSRHITACDLMLQPYPDGVSSRRTSVMVSLAHGRATVTTIGALTESLWKEQGAVALAPAGDAAAMADEAAKLLADWPRLRRLAADARGLYETRFKLASTIAALKEADGEAPAERAVS